MTEHAEAIWKIADKMRGRRTELHIDALLNECKAAGVPVGMEELQYIISKRNEYLDHFVPTDVADFIARIIEPSAPDSILDPWAGYGILAMTVKSKLNPRIMEAYVPNRNQIDVWQVYGEDSAVVLHHAEALNDLPQSDRIYDAVVGCPPWGLSTRQTPNFSIENQSLRIKDEYGHLLILASCQRLAQNGLGVFIVYGKFFHASNKIRSTIHRLGLRITAAIELPAGTFSPLTGILTHIVVLERTSHQELFTGRYSPDPKHQTALLKNLAERQNGTNASLGRVVDGLSFTGFTPIEISEQITEQARRMGFQPFEFSEVAQEVNTPLPGALFTQLAEKPNSVYLPMMASISATTSQRDLPEHLKSYYQIVLKPEIADAAFVAGLLNTDFGQLWRDLLRTGTTIPRIGKESLISSTIYLPPSEARGIQQAVTNCSRNVNTLISELGELKEQLWKRPLNIEHVRASLLKVNKEDRFQDWIDSLPFPLASILWVCHTQTGAYRDQYERKIQFFEALAEFLATVFLSAFTKYPGWSELKQKITKTLMDNSLTLEKATFGVWRIIVELLSAETRRCLSKELELCFELFKTRNRSLLESISSKRIVKTLQAANTIRNNSVGHVGAVSDAAACAINEELNGRIAEVRAVFGVVWEEYSLLLPGTCKVKEGVHEYTVQYVMGTRTPFATDRVRLSESMEDGQLHLWSSDARRVLKLIPLVKVMPSPKTAENACYFYSRKQSDGIRFLSYHFASESEVVESFSEVDETLNILISTE